MESFHQALGYIALHGYWFFAAALVAVFIIRDSEKRVGFLRVALVFGGIIVGSIFVGAALGKLMPLDGFAWGRASLRLSILQFATEVEGYKILSPSGSMFVARTLPFGELFLGLWLAVGILRRYAGLLASVLLLGFMSAIAYAYLHGMKIDCSCGIGPAEQAGPAAILRDGEKFFLPSVLLTIGAFYVHRSRAKSRVVEAVPAVAHAD